MYNSYSVSYNLLKSGFIKECGVEFCFCKEILNIGGNMQNIAMFILVFIINVFDRQGFPFLEMSYTSFTH